MSSPPPLQPSPAVDMRWFGIAVLTLAALGLGLWLGRQGTDLTLLQALNQAGNDAPSLWSTLTTLGLGSSLFVVGSALCPPGRAQRLPLLAALLCSYPIGGVLTEGAKWLFHAARPAALLSPGQLHVIGRALTSHTTSMPSGHALAATTLAVLWLRLGGAGPAARVAGALLALAVAASRMAVGAHWPSDVLVGIALGIAAALLAEAAAARTALATRLPAWWAQGGVALLQISVGAALITSRSDQPLMLPATVALGLLGIAGGVLRARWIARAAMTAARHTRGHA